MSEEKTEQKAKPEQKISKSKVNFWMVSTLVLVVIVLIVAGFSLTGAVVGASDKILSPTECGNRAKAYIENNLLPPGATISVVNVSDSDGVYLITTSYQGQYIPIYMTKDGKYMFLSAVDITKPIPKPQFSPPRTAKPTVELFVMSFCPYGIQAENTMKPIVDLFKNNADFQVRFIVNINGNTTSSIDSLHGPNEAAEDLRQVCIMKYYPDKYWDYLMEFDSKCSSLSQNAAGLDTCWKAAAIKFGIDTNKIQTCADTEGLNLLKTDEQATQQYGVSGSPTLIINGQQYSGSRSSGDFQNAICSAFRTPPAACSQTVNASTSASTATSGSCGA